ncbi:MAG: hypothetical protein Q8R47_04975 [Nanoarchaeota archaeon]|nr:hypothetical protein [Nanoarchaeota archaeon]
MVLSDKNRNRMKILSTISMVGGLAGTVYFAFARPTSEEKLLQELNGRKTEVNHDMVNCVPRDRKTSISDFCINSARLYDSLGKEIETVENSPAYISAQRDKLYSFGLWPLVFFSFASAVYLDRKEKNKNRWYLPQPTPK